ncbi:NUDIX hydrolase [Lysobacter panacisoli]|uniref:NUDIX hydrolase n=1 Tax=Lysobacter panacisoli TaxID=1255263 RepID=A0ABP9LQJ7_9GAMM|nr:NUDIX hydrolase [Lysobacter panacisoli]
MPRSSAPEIALLRETLSLYGRSWPDEHASVTLFTGLLDEADAPMPGADPFSRERLGGHFTASSWLVDRSGTRVLLTHHRKLERWLQLGGHADGDRDLARVALREAEEESGLSGLTVEPEMFDLDRHWIPERGDVPGHWHYDVRYVVHAGDDEGYVVSEESHDLAWRSIDEILADASSDESMLRMAKKWMERAGKG